MRYRNDNNNNISYLSKCYLFIADNNNHRNLEGSRKASNMNHDDLDVAGIKSALRPASTILIQSWIFKTRCHCRCHCRFHYKESPDALNDRCRWFSSDSEVVQESPRESLFKDRYFVSGIGSGIAKRSKDLAQY